MQHDTPPQGISEALTAAGNTVPKIVEAVKNSLSYATLLAVFAALIVIAALFGKEQDTYIRMAALLVAIALTAIASWFVWVSHIKVKTHMVKEFQHLESQPLSNFMKSSPLPMFITELTDDDSLLIRRCNEALLTFSGLKLKEIQGKPIEDLIAHIRKYVMPEHLKEFDRSQKQRVYSLKKRSAPNGVFFTVVDNAPLDPIAGKKYDLTVRTFPMRDHRENEIGAYSIWIAVPSAVRPPE